MRWFEDQPIEVVEREDCLLIRATGPRHWLEIVVPPLIMGAFCVEFAHNKSWFSLAGIIFILVVGAKMWFGDRSCELHVTEKDLESFGSSRNGWSGHLRIRWSAISGLEYGSGGEDDPSGLYTRVGGAPGICIMPGLSEEQVVAVIAAIYTRFPYPEMADDCDSDWTLFGHKSDLTTLGLLKPRD